MLKRVKIQGYKSLLDVEVNLQPLSVLFGPNATGKSNFLDALQLLSRIATSTRLKDAFAPPYRGKPLESFTFGSDGVQGLRAKQKVVFSIEVDVEISRRIIDDIEIQAQEMGKEQTLNPFYRERFLRYRIEIEMLPHAGILRVADEYVAALDESGALKNQPPLFETRTDVFIVQGQNLQRRQFLKRRVAGRSIFTERSFLNYLPYIDNLRQELLSWSFFYLEPRERMRAPSPVGEVDRIGEMGEDIAAFLYTLRLVDKTQFKAVESALHMAVPSINGIEVNINAEGDIELSFLEGKTSVSSRVVSDGTLRVLGLLAISSMKEKASLIGFEEPENGVYPYSLQFIASLLKTRSMHDSQIIITTHSPVLLDLFPHKNLLVCREKKGYTIIDPLSNWDLSDGGKALDDDGEEELAVSELILRGDFDALRTSLS